MRGVESTSAGTSVWVVVALRPDQSSRATRPVRWRMTEADAEAVAAVMRAQQEALAAHAERWLREHPRPEWPEGPSECQHSWVDGGCVVCGATGEQAAAQRTAALEASASYRGRSDSWWRSMCDAFEEAEGGIVDPLEWERDASGGILLPVRSAYSVVEVPE